MSIAKGSKSKLAYLQEYTFGVPRVNVAYRALLFSTESLVENIDTFQSQDIRPDRATSAIRGGNIACGGTVSSDFAIDRFDEMLMHLLASARPAAVAVNPPFGGHSNAITTATAYVRGQYGTAAGNLYCVKIGGTYTGTPSSDFNGYTSGDQTVGGVTWQYVGPDSTPVYHYQLVAGVDFPPYGIAVEKQVIGGSQNLYVAYEGGRVDSLDLTIGQKDIVKASWALEFLQSVSGSATQVQPTAINTPDDDPVSGYESFISLDNNQTARPIKEGTLSIKNNVDKEAYVLGDRTRIDLPEGTRGLTAKITTFFQDNTEYEYFKNETVVPAVFSFLHDGEFLAITFEECKLTGSGTPQVSGAGMVTAAFDLTAFLQTADNDVTIDIYSLSNTLFANPSYP